MDIRDLANKSMGILEGYGIVGNKKTKFELMMEGIDGTFDRANVPVRSEDALIFMFESYSEANSLYLFMTESRLLEPGEVIMEEVSDGYKVEFTPMVVFQKPHVVEAAMIAYEERLETEDMDAFESMLDILDAPLDEATTSGAPNRKARGKGNPYHDERGRLCGPENTPEKDSGCWAMKKVKLKVVGKGKAKDGGLLVKYGSTKRPCGREARRQGKNVRCRDGQAMESIMGEAIASGTRYRDMDMAVKALVMELNRHYKGL